MRKKIPYPVSIDEELAAWIAKEVEKGEFRNRSHLVEQAILEFKRKQEQKLNRTTGSPGGEAGNE